MRHFHRGWLPPMVIILIQPRLLCYPMKFCTQCGNGVTLRVPDGDDRPRYVCDACEYVHYQNPRIVAGCLPVHGDRVLMCRRAIEPRKGYWTVPAGFMENGETVEQAALRETFEEARARVELDGIYAMFSLPHISQVYVFFRGTLETPDFGVGDESLEVKLFAEHEIPWKELAFPTINRTLEFYFEDRVNGAYPVRTREIGPYRPR